MKFLKKVPHIKTNTFDQKYFADLYNACTKYSELYLNRRDFKEAEISSVCYKILRIHDEIVNAKGVNYLSDPIWSKFRPYKGLDWEILVYIDNVNQLCEPPNIDEVNPEELNSAIEQRKFDENTRLWDRKCFEFDFLRVILNTQLID